MSEELKPCPFCGVQPERINVGHVTEAVCCRSPACKLRPQIWNGSSSVSGWNTRTPVPPLDDVEVRARILEEAAKACEERAKSYREARAPGWHEVDHECTQCAAAIRALSPVRKEGE